MNNFKRSWLQWSMPCCLSKFSFIQVSRTSYIEETPTPHHPVDCIFSLWSYTEPLTILSKISSRKFTVQSVCLHHPPVLHVPVTQDSTAKTITKYPFYAARKTAPIALEKPGLQTDLALFTVADCSTQNQKPLERTIIVLVQHWVTCGSGFLPLHGEVPDSGLQKTFNGRQRSFCRPHYNKRQNQKYDNIIFYYFNSTTEKRWEDRRYKWILNKCENTGHIWVIKREKEIQDCVNEMEYD